LILSVVLTLVAVIGLTGRRAGSDTGRVGRFQIASGCYLSSVGEGVIEKDDVVLSTCGIFKIDTVTGETWIYRERVNTQSVLRDEVTGEWEPID
jgi:hypothetical protein